MPAVTCWCLPDVFCWFPGASGCLLLLPREHSTVQHILVPVSTFSLLDAGRMQKSNINFVQ